jgi:hypothetical protein
MHSYVMRIVRPPELSIPLEAVRGNAIQICQQTAQFVVGFLVEGCPLVPVF